MFEDEIQQTIRMPKALRLALKDRAHEHRRSMNSEMVVAFWLYVGNREEAARVPGDGRELGAAKREEKRRAQDGRVLPADE